MAITDFGGTVLGKPISVVGGDHQLKADIGAAIARRWYDIEQVDLIVDVPVSAVGLAVQSSPMKGRNSSSPIQRARRTFTANFVRPTRSNGCSIRTRLRLAPRRRW
jgi:Periplasmic binding protein